jgi:hypothetical protein
MLKQADQKILSALASLRGDNNFETVCAWLRDSLQDLQSESTKTRDDVLCRWLQGGAQAVEELLHKADNAQKVLQKSR